MNYINTITKFVSSNSTKLKNKYMIQINDELDFSLLSILYKVKRKVHLNHVKNIIKQAYIDIYYTQEDCKRAEAIICKYNICFLQFRS